MDKRRYRLQDRAAQQARTRQRIVEATAELHAEVGPAATTISAVAQRAGVQRLTVYRHFPDEVGLFAACAQHTGERYPPPDPSLWNGIDDPAQRLETALRALYGYYRDRGTALALVLRDAERLPALREALAPLGGFMEAVAARLAEGWEAPGEGERALRAALGHALEFWTWRSLHAHGLAPDEAARLMARMVAAAPRVSGD